LFIREVIEVAEEEKEELEEKEEESASWFKRIGIFVIVLLVASVAYLLMHISKMNRELEYLASLNVYEQEEVEDSSEVLGIESEELDTVVSALMEETGLTINEIHLRLNSDLEGETAHAFGFGYGAELGSDNVDELYENARALLEGMEFELATEEVEGLEAPLVVFISYEKDGIICNLIRMDIEEKESSELEIGCFLEGEMVNAEN
jgi:flagellar biogenesis protein FliO